MAANSLTSPGSRYHDRSQLHDCVVLIDDCANLCETLAYSLREAGIGVHTAEDGRAGLQAVREHRPKVVLLDLLMPHMSGYDVLDAIRADPMLAGVVVIIMTGMTDDQNELAEIAEKANLCLGKPIDTDRLLREVRKAFVHASGRRGLLARIQSA